MARTHQITIAAALTVLFLPAPPASAQQANLDWKVHDVGRVRQVVTNMGTLWGALTNYPGLIYAEFPPGSFEEHVAEGGIKVSAVVSGDTLVSNTNFNNGHQNFEFFPTNAADDTVWVVTKADGPVDIPYRPGYTAVSDQDFVTRYSDYNVLNISDHNPLYVDVIQTSYAWASPPLDEVITFTYDVVPTRHDLTDVYVAFQLQGRVGTSGVGVSLENVQDDRSILMPDDNLAIIEDRPGDSDGEAISPVGIKMFPPEGYTRKTMQWYTHHHEVPTTDELTYADQLSSGEIMQSQNLGGQAIVTLSYGPYDVAVGDTLSFVAAEIFGMGLDGLLDNATRLSVIYDQDFKVPSPPPAPPLRLEARNQQVTLRWKAEAGDPDPETFTDPYRGDDIDQPFEGYRIYKSTRSMDGPWTLLAEFDVPNGLGYDTGLEYEFTDTGLLNNFEYYYAVTAYAREDEVLDFPRLESGLLATAAGIVPGTEAPETVGRVAVVPNPYRGDAGYQDYNPPWEKPAGSRSRWLEQDRRIQFINLPAQCEIRIYTVAGDLVETLRHDDSTRGYEDWNLTSSVGQAIASGIYLFTVEDAVTGEMQVGNFVIIK